mgnify:FL=1
MKKKDKNSKMKGTPKSRLIMSLKDEKPAKAVVKKK